MAAPKTKAQDLIERLGPVWLLPDEFTLHLVLSTCESELRGAAVDAIALHRAAARAALFLGQYDHAVQHWNDSLKIDGGRPETWMNLGVVRMQQRQYDDALEALMRAADIAGEDAWSDVALLANLAEALWMVGRRGDAVVILRAAHSAAEDGNVDHLFRLADATSAMDEPLAAVRLLARCLARGQTMPAQGVADLPDLVWLRTRCEVVALSPALDAAIAFAEQYVRALSSIGEGGADNDTANRSAVFAETGWLRGRATVATRAN